MIPVVRAGELHFRRDLLCRRLQMGSHNVWVLKDPLSRDIQYVDEDEFAILQLTNGRRTVQELLNECSLRFSTRFVSAEGMLHFLADAKRRRLILDSGATEFIHRDRNASYDKNSNTPAPWWKQILAIRLPGIRPDRFLEFVFPVVSPLLTRKSAVVYWLFVLLATLIAIVHWGSITENIATAFLNRGTHTLVQFVIVISTLKIIHELAHAVACKACGGDCRELGIMLLMGVPCLYCDVSDAWTMPQRSKRMLISAAGMIAEVGIASIATILWLWTSDAQLKEWWLVVMVVCSVSTIAVNGNPLMRYDGYFLLSDLIGIPNLAAKSSAALRQISRCWLWSEPIINVHERDDRQRMWLAIYALTCGIYRIVVVAALAAVIYRFTYGNGFAILGIMLSAFLAIGTIVPAVRGIFMSSNRLFGLHRDGKRTRSSSIVSLILLALLLIPLPQSVIAPLTIRSINSHDIYVTVGGRLTQCLRKGALVREGESIAILSNADVEGQLLDAESRFQSLITQNKSFSSRRSADPTHSAAMMESSAAEKAALERVRLLNNEVEKLKLLAPVDGVIFAPEKKLSTLSANNDLETWTGTPLDSANLGAWLEPGTILCVVGDATAREAILMIDQKAASQIKLGQRVTIQIPSISGDLWEGKVIEVSSTPVVDCPTELIASGMVTVEPTMDKNRNSVPTETMYQARVELNRSSVPLPIRTIGSARVYVDSASLFSRISRTFFQSFRL